MDTDQAKPRPRRPKGLGSGPFERRNAAGKLTGYWGLVDLGVKPDGKRDRRRVRGRTKREWEQNAEALRRAQTEGTLPAASKETVGAYLDRWLAGIEPPKSKLKLRSWQFYGDNVRLYLKPLLGRTALTRLTVDDVNDCCTALLHREPTPLNGRSVRGVRATLRAALSAAVKGRLLKVNVAALSDAPDVEAHEPATLEETELRQFQEMVGSHPLRALFYVLSTTGCRIGEALALRFSDLDPEQGVIVIRAALRTRGTPALDTPKSRKGVRTVPLLPFVEEAIRQYSADDAFQRRRNLGERDVVQAALGVPADTIFTRPNGQWLAYGFVERELKAVFGRARLPRIKPHEFRHTTGSLLAQRGVPANHIAELLGHSDPAFTQRTYIHGNEETRRRVRAEIADIAGR